MSIKNEDKNFAALNLAEMREVLDRIDKEMLDYLNLRLEAAARIHDLKNEFNKPILDNKREDLKLEAAIQSVTKERENALYSFMQQLMNLSREEQYRLTLEKKNAVWRLGELIAHASKKKPDFKVGAYQGSASSYSALAAEYLFPEAKWMPFTSFESTCQQVVERAVEVAVLPLENSSAGTVNDVYALLGKNELYIVSSTNILIQHCLLASADAKLSDIRKVYSHPQALEQCSIIIKGMGWEVEQSENTSYAAKKIAESQDKTIAAIGSKLAAKKYNLNILSQEITNDPYNQTRFIAVAAQPIITEKANKISLILRLPHKVGSLTQVLAMFADRGINLSKIQSFPTARKPWEYSFYIDAFTEKHGDRIKDLLYQLEKETRYVRLLGWYEEK